MPVKSNNIKPKFHSLLKKINIIYAIGTDAGKTHITSSIISSFKKSKEIFAIKPIITGLTAQNFEESDNFKLLQALGRQNLTFEDISKISCYCFKKPLSPDIASWSEEVEIDFEKVVNFCKQFSMQNFRHLFIETAGGVCSPISNFQTMKDISLALKDFSPQNILIVNEYLGAISHTVSALQCLNFQVIIFNQCSENFIKSIQNHTSNHFLMYFNW